MDHTSGNNPPGQFQNQNMQHQNQPPQEPGSPKKKFSMGIIWRIVGACMFFALIGFLIILALLVPDFMKARSRGQLTSCTSNLMYIGTACEMYSTDHDGAYPKSLSDLLKPSSAGEPHLKSIPKCPGALKNQTDSYGYIYYNSPSKNYYGIWCKHANHAAGGLAPECKEGYPQFDSDIGLIAPLPGEEITAISPPEGATIAK